MGVKSIYEIRVENLTQLVKQHGTQGALSRAVGISPTSVSRILAWREGSTDPGRKKLGERLARKIEAQLRLAPLWMDTMHENDSAPDQRAPSPPLNWTHVARLRGDPTTGLSPIQLATHDTLVKLMAAGRLPDSACLKLLEAWQAAVTELEAGA
jgi:hypothetical protein